MRRLDDPPTEGHWIALEKEILDGLSLRRRIRGKTAVKRLQKEVEDEETKEEKFRNQVKRLLEEEALLALEDPPSIAILTSQMVAKMKRSLAQESPEEEEVLQTRIVSPKEVAAGWVMWEAPSQDEITSLLTDKLALKPVTKGEVKRMVEDAESKGVKVEFIPSKLVFTRKPGKKGGKKKVRWVVCGNFESKDPNEENFSAGADSAALRIMVWVAVVYQWELCGGRQDSFFERQKVPKRRSTAAFGMPTCLFRGAWIAGQGHVLCPTQSGLWIPPLATPVG